MSEPPPSPKRRDTVFYTHDEVREKLGFDMPPSPRTPSSLLPPGPVTLITCPACERCPCCKGVHSVPAAVAAAWHIDHRII